MNFYNLDWFRSGDTIYKSASAVCDVYNVNIVHLKKVINDDRVEHYFWNKRTREVIPRERNCKEFKAYFINEL